MAGVYQNLIGVHDLTTHFSGMFAIRGLALATINLSIKIEVPIFSYYKGMRGDTKCGKWGGMGLVRGHSRSMEIAPFDRVHTSFY